MPVTNSTTFPHLNKRIKNLNGQTFGRLFVIGYAKTETDTKSRWLCQCECGKFVIVDASKLMNSHTQSCGCLKYERLKQATTIHGESAYRNATDEYNIFHGLKKRCENPRSHAYPSYGGNGIECRLESVVDLLDAIGRRPTKQHSVERINNKGHYEKGNIKWGTKQEQARNRKSNVLITAFGRTQLMVEWGEETGIKSHTIAYRIHSGKWCDECAVAIKPYEGTCLHC